MKLNIKEKFAELNWQKLKKPMAAGLAAVVLLGAVALVSGGKKKPVYVYNFYDGIAGMTDYQDFSGQSDGMITTDRLQTVPISKTQKVIEIPVTDGQEVKKGDLLFTYDTTLSDLQLQQKDLSVQQLKLDLETAIKELRVINGYVPISQRPVVTPEPVPEEEKEPELPDLDLEDLDFKSYKGRGDTSLTPRYCWLRSEAMIDQAMIEQLFKDMEAELEKDYEDLPEAERPEIPEQNVLFVVFQQTEEDKNDGAITDEHMLKIMRLEDKTAKPTPSPEISPEPEVTPSPEVSPSPEVTPSPEVNPSPEVKPSPEVNPSPEVKPSPEVNPSPEIKPSPEVAPTEPTPEAEPQQEQALTPPALPAEAPMPKAMAYVGLPVAVAETEPGAPAPEAGDTAGPENGQPESPEGGESPAPEGGETIPPLEPPVDPDTPDVPDKPDVPNTEDKQYIYRIGFFVPKIEEPENPDDGFDMNSGFTAAQIAEMRAAKQQEIKQLQFDAKVAESEFSIMQKEADNGEVRAEFDGVVTALLEPEAALEENKPLMKVSGGGGFYVNTQISEFQLSEAAVGQTVSINSWDTGMSYDGEIVEISEFPLEGDRYYGNAQHASYYPVKVFIDESANLQDGFYVSISMQGGGTGSSLYINNAFLRKDGPVSYVYVRNEKDKLEKRTVHIGASLWGSYTQILGGIRADDWVAFPYGKDVKDGAPTMEGNYETISMG